MLWQMKKKLTNMLASGLGVLACSVAPALASEVRLDTLMVGGATSPCLAIHVNILQAGKSLSQLNLGPTGIIKVQKGETVHFEKGKKNLIQANCISGSTFSQNTGLNFQADGRTIIVQFSDQGFQIRRGGVAY
jgi:hypothetical protein